MAKKESAEKAVRDIRRLAGQEKSAKHRKADALMAKGQPIRILGESDFLRMVRGL